jgi:hypothetical protein
MNLIWRIVKKRKYNNTIQRQISQPLWRSRKPERAMANILSIRFRSSASQRALLNSPVQVVDLTAPVVELQLAVVAAADCDFSCSLCQSFPGY